MEAYRDQYATLFNAGKRVIVIGISTDADTTQASWAREYGFPNLFASDPDQAVAKLRLGRQIARHAQRLRGGARREGRRAHDAVQRVVHRRLYGARYRRRERAEDAGSVALA